ncbi:FAR-17a/AIG1-like protein [Umbelopsis sp. AD052]|nr:FAR-17a/AIG1-like protein [Umbelopsis sp. AD052]
MSRFTRTSLHLLGSVSNLWALYNVGRIVNPYANGFGGHYQYLTILGLTVATISFLLCLIRDFIPGFLNKVHSVIGSIAVPLEGLISALYWGMIFLDPKLLIPADAPKIPVFVDCCLHLFPALFLWIDFLFFNVEFKRSSSHVVNIYLFTIAYYVWTSYCYSKNKYYAYPFLADMTTNGRLVFFAVSGTICWLMYELGAYIHKSLHPPLSTKDGKKQE